MTCSVTLVKLGSILVRYVFCTSGCISRDIYIYSSPVLGNGLNAFCNSGCISRDIDYMLNLPHWEMGCRILIGLAGVVVALDSAVARDALCNSGVLAEMCRCVCNLRGLWCNLMRGMARAVFRKWSGSVNAFPTHIYIYIYKMMQVYLLVHCRS